MSDLVADSPGLSKIFLFSRFVVLTTRIETIESGHKSGRNKTKREKENKMERNDGLNNVLSINSGVGATWAAAEARCEESDAVKSWDREGGTMTIVWCDDSTSEATDPQAALSEINAMEAC